jgi:hypothetical protein
MLARFLYSFQITDFQYIFGKNYKYFTTLTKDMQG